jgi:hypothetical protein
MSDPVTTLPPLSDRSGVTDAVRAQILASEHWSLLATRSMTWNEILSRTTTFITVLSAAVVALALVAQATAFGTGFRLFALVVLPVVLLVGLGTVIRLFNASTDDLELVVGMNRLRHAYLELAPELEPYFVMAHHDDKVSVERSYSLGYRIGYSRILSGTLNLVAAINAVVVGVLTALIAQTLGAPEAVNLVIGVVAALAAAVGYGTLASRQMTRAWRALRPRFPGEARRVRGPQPGPQSGDLGHQRSSL